MMNLSVTKRVLLFVAISYSLAILIDCIVFYLNQLEYAFLWGFARMWSVTLATIICLYIGRESILTSLKSIINPVKKVLKPYLIAPFVVYLALCIYIAIATPLNLFNLNAYISAIVEFLVEHGVPEEQARIIATIAVYSIFILGYMYAITINALFALGEEIGWRGYLFDQLKNRPMYLSTIIIGLIWGYWHTSAIILLGHNYYINRFLGGFVLFPLFTTAITYPYLELVRRSKSVLPAASLHGALNALWGITIVASTLPPEASEIYLGLGVLGIVSWTILSVALYLALRFRQRYLLTPKKTNLETP